MATGFPFDPNVTNSALEAYGSDFRVPGMSQPSAPPQAAPGASGFGQAQPSAPPPAAPATEPPTAQPLPPPPPSVQPSPAPPGGETNTAPKGKSTEQLAKASKVAEANKDNAKMAKIGALVSTILSAYTGNAAGVASGGAAMEQADDQEEMA